MRPRTSQRAAYPIQVPVCDVVCVKIVKAFCYVQQLGRGRIIG